MDAKAKRKNIRLEVFQEITGTVLETAEEVTCAVTDVAAGGLSLRLDHMLETGTVLRLTLPALEDISALTLECEVKWCRWINEAFNAGCAFNFKYQIDEDRVARYANRIHSNRLQIS
ncbi:MAG: PilZ domain-containing protein [Oscillospiraceae bacterium]|nr:PilZ domain-containing protein [Oscillospiraceae bacterium]